MHTGGKGARTLHILSDLGVHLTERGGLLHILEVVLHLVKHLQLRTRAWVSTAARLWERGAEILSA